MHVIFKGDFQFWEFCQSFVTMTCAPQVPDLYNIATTYIISYLPIQRSCGRDFGSPVIDHITHEYNNIL